MTGEKGGYGSAMNGYALGRLQSYKQVKLQNHDRMTLKEATTGDCSGGDRNMNG